MRHGHYSPRHRQRGAILVIALMFLVAITLYTISSMRSSNIGLFMAQNEESRVAAEQAAQALADAIVATRAQAVTQAQGAVQAATSVAADSNVASPFAARVVRTMVEVGDLAAPGRPLVQVESREGQQIWLTVREADITRLAVGDEIPVRLDARPELGTLTGTIREIEPASDPATHTTIVKADLGRAQVPTGLSGRAVIAGDTDHRLFVPLTAVHRRGGLELVVVRAADGGARTRAAEGRGRGPGGARRSADVRRAWRRRRTTSPACRSRRPGRSTKTPHRQTSVRRSLARSGGPPKKNRQPVGGGRDGR